MQVKPLIVAALLAAVGLSNAHAQMKMPWEWLQNTETKPQEKAPAQQPQHTMVDLQKAIESQDLARVAYLLREARLDPNFYFENGDTPLVFAIRVEAYKTIELVLLKSRALNVNIPSLRGETPLMLAAFRGNEALVRTLLGKGADPKVHYDWTALHYAATTGQVAIAQLLIENGAPVNARTSRNVTPLYMAARSGSEKVVELLLKAGADKTICNDQGISPELVATQRGFAALGKTLHIERCQALTPEDTP